MQASNTFGSSNTVSFKIGIEQTVPTISEIPAQSATEGDSFVLDISLYCDQGEDPISKFQALGLPDGLSLNPTNGVISGAPATAGSYTPRVAAYNSYGWSEYRQFELTVEESEETDENESTAQKKLAPITSRSRLLRLVRKGGQ